MHKIGRARLSPHTHTHTHTGDYHVRVYMCQVSNPLLSLPLLPHYFLPAVTTTVAATTHTAATSARACAHRRWRWQRGWISSILHQIGGQWQRQQQQRRHQAPFERRRWRWRGDRRHTGRVGTCHGRLEKAEDGRKKVEHQRRVGLDLVFCPGLAVAFNAFFAARVPTFCTRDPPFQLRRWWRRWSTSAQVDDVGF